MPTLPHSLGDRRLSARQFAHRGQLRGRVHWPVLWSCFLLCVLLGPLFSTLSLDTALLTRDMVVLNHPAMTLSAVGFGDNPARATPQDGLLALVGYVMPASWFVRLLLVGVGLFAAASAAQAGRTTWQKLAAITVCLFNPFVVERLLQGHWSLVIAAWLLPAIYLRRGAPLLVALWLCSLTPTGAVAAFIVLACRRPHLRYLLFALITWLPWLIPSLLFSPVSRGTDVFFGRAEEAAGTLGTFLGLGGLWNIAAIPESRNLGFALISLLLTVILVFFMPRRLQLLSAGATAAFLLLWLGPGAWIVHTIPGAALFRDSHKLALFLIPGLVLAAGRISFGGRQRFRFLSHSGAIVVIGLSLLALPDAPHALRALRPLPISQQWVRHEGDVVQLDNRGLVNYHGRTIVDPLTKATSVLSAGELRIDNTLIDPPNPRFLQAEKAWRSHDHPTLCGMGISAVHENNTIHPIACTTTPIQPYRTEYFRLGIVLISIWIAQSLIPCAFGIRAYARRRKG
ncbi:hypothetical protein P4N68_10425 [Corynebacterium felinum]|uniref:Transmembrane protein n=1 Tax=Corynebacterium felinum TaxID=131318 RepID=A0ABU2B5V8_9CORY|nr:hypothetical protein [Corynebacterium felinum]MDF5821487.1 hypothetical protein [Corynebacterium felinum]MDR7354005.1 hypothetical protein [Corynebacterium felinum]WJY96179.1 hypothetical protein CFELI_13000 [Corynebacterium felinum]